MCLSAVDRVVSMAVLPVVVVLQTRSRVGDRNAQRDERHGHDDDHRATQRRQCTTPAAADRARPQWPHRLPVAV